MPVRVIVAVYGKPGKDRASGETATVGHPVRSCNLGVTVASVPQLNVTIRQQGQVCVLSVSGELDIATAPILAGYAAALRGLTGRLIVDLSGLEFMDGGGARALAAVTSAAPPGCAVLVRGMTRRFRKLFDILALPLERHGEVTMGRVAWAVLESQVLRSWAQQTRADSEVLIAKSRRRGIGAAGPGPGLKVSGAESRPSGRNRRAGCRCR